MRRAKDSLEPKAPTVVDVAREAGVSASTAARVLRTSTYPVSREVKERVRVAAAKLGYVPNMHARMLRGAEAPYIGVVVGSLDDPYFGQIAEAVTTEASGIPAFAIVANMRRDPALEIEVCRQLWQHRVAGLILSGGGFDQQTHGSELRGLVNKMTKAGVIVVTLAERDLDVPIFSVSNFDVGMLMAETLIDLNHSSIGVIMGPPKSIVAQRRLEGARSAFTRAGVSWSMVYANYGVGQGAEGVDRLLDQDRSITAIMTGGDTLSVGAMMRLKERGFVVPNDFSLIGVGDTFYSRLATPTLATINVRLRECAKAAVRHILAGMRSEQAAPPAPVASTLVPGGSLGPPRTEKRYWAPTELI